MPSPTSTPSNTIQVGQRVQIKKTQTTCLVTKIIHYNPANPIEEHGFIDLEVVKPGTNKYLKPGDVETYVHHGWEEFLTILP